MSAITTSDLTKRYGRNTVLDGLSLDVSAGETLVLLGPNGAGKTTTVEILAGFATRDGGKVRVLGNDPGTDATEAWRSRIGLALQVWRDHGRWRVGEFLTWVRCHYLRPECPEPYPVDELIERFDLAGHLGKPINKLSGGLRRRLDLAAAVVGRPELLFLDEPTTGLDPSAKRRFHDVMADLSDGATTVFLTSHDLAEAERLADRIVILDQGRIVAQGSADQLRRAVEGTVEVTWSSNGQRHLHATGEPEQFIRGLLHEPEVADLEVRRTTLEDAYLKLVSAAEPTASETTTAEEDPR